MYMQQPLTGTTSTPHEISKGLKLHAAAAAAHMSNYSVQQFGLNVLPLDFLLGCSVAVRLP
jgi:hypothetical protein